MKKLFLYIPAMLLLAVSCEKEAINSSDNGNESASGVKMITEIVSGSRGDVTKATIGNANPTFAWTAGDNVAVHVSHGDSHEYVITSKGADAAASSAKFEVTYGEGYSRDAFALYPSNIVSASAANYGQSSHTLDVTLPGSYTLAQVSGETSPCPMISANEAGSGWHFYQLCGLLRLTVNGIPAAAKRLEIDFNGMQVCGDFSIASPVTPGSSAIASTSDDANDVITITKDGTNVALGAESLVLNFPLPTGTYKKVTVIAYDAVTGGNALLGTTISLNNYSANITRATKKVATLGPLQSTFNFTFKNNSTTLNNVRFARVFSVKNKLHNGTSIGPFTASSDSDLPTPINAVLYFEKVSGEQLVFQVVTNDGKVYSGILDAPSEGYDIGGTHNVTANVNPYTFTISSGKKVYFSPGDLGIAGGVYSFTEPFETWGWNESKATNRVWFNYSEVLAPTVYGVQWRIENYVSSAYEWNNIINRKFGDDPSYYRVNVAGHSNCLLLLPDETVLTSDEKTELMSGSIGADYAKYLGKGFVLLVSTGYANVVSGNFSWLSSSEGWYWSYRNSSNRYYFKWTNSGVPFADFFANQARMRVRLINNAE